MSRGPKEDPEGEKAQKVFPELCDRVNQEAGDEGIGVFRGEEGEDEVKRGFPGSKPRQALNGEEGGEFGSGDSDREEGSSGGREGKVGEAYEESVEGEVLGCPDGEAEQEEGAEEGEAGVLLQNHEEVGRKGAKTTSEEAGNDSREGEGGEEEEDP